MQNHDEPFHYVTHRQNDGEAARALHSAMGKIGSIT